mgnify:CR=1 FL=1
MQCRRYTHQTLCNLAYEEMDAKEAQIIFLGFVLCIFLAKALKRYFKVPRPHPTNTYGMPSTRGTEVGFLLVFLLAAAPGLSAGQRCVMLLAAALCLFVKWADNQHTAAQLLAGLLLGGFTGYAAVELLT